MLVEPIAILKIEDKDGNVIEENFPEKREVLSKETAYLMTNLMEGGVNEEGGTGRVIRSFFALPAAGKTGTTNDYGDAWFIGFTPQLVAGAWVGFDDHMIKFGSADGQGGRAAAPIFGRFMQYAYEDPEIHLPLEYFRQPEGIVGFWSYCIYKNIFILLIKNNSRTFWLASYKTAKLCNISLRIIISICIIISIKK